jgi:uracil-DNA glycosylase
MRTLNDVVTDIREHMPCGYEPCETCIQFVFGEGNQNADIVFIGEAPGATEDEEGRPFVGKAGKLLDKLLAEAGLERKKVFITNILKARPPANRDPTPDEIKHSLPWLNAQLEIIQPKVIVTLGRIALSCFLPAAKVSAEHGMLITATVTYGPVWIYPMYHPSAGLRIADVRKTLYSDAARLNQLLTHI